MKIPTPFFVKHETVRDVIVALAWAFFVGMPLFTLHMLVLDYEHYVHGMSLQFSFGMSLQNMIPYHPISIGLWLIAVFSTTYSLRRSFRKQREIFMMRGQIKRSLIEAHADALTGILNRRGFDHHLDTRLAYTKKENRPLTIMMVDVDNFKALNDQHGHVVGDNVLRAIAKHLSQLVRSQDLVARYGGDEFVIICPGLSKEDAKGMANRIRKSLSAREIALSIGVATYPTDAQNKTDLLVCADKQMYDEKNNHHHNIVE
ncbi:MAG: GGDEF domain-containing protein [Anaerolineae bacterium]|jgi:diguanylate cyclase (GGDEF)-like protein|nr:GGDEF domain-containing protein [Anaerolineae bacterium]